MKEEYPMPTVHTNGTSKQVLLDGYLDIASAIQELKEVVSKSYFHGRDYYVQDNDPAMDAFNDDNAFSRAYDARAKHLRNLAQFEEYIHKHYKHVSLQKL